MGLSPGQRLGTYEIVSALGAGGMGEVYRARDTKLLRDVAIKVLPESMAADRDRLARFEREAQLLAALNHPHIAGIYGLEQSGDTCFLAMELVDGETLADRIARGGALAGGEALAIAKQLGDALEAAHDKGIIHRDLKPANIALTADGQVKVLDFGLAKAMETPAAVSSVSPAGPTFSPTLSLAMTQAGMILGTAAYMSPEQAKGRPADKRADVWAFGCVLFEMLTGKRAFEGEDASDTLAAVLRGEPDWKRLPRRTPAHIRTVLHGCLEKDRKARMADIAVVSYLLREPAHTRAAETTLSRRAWVAIATTAAGVAAVVAALTWWVTRPGTESSPLMRFGVVLPGDVSVASTTTDRQLAISPDGTQIVYVTSQGLALRTLDRLEIVRVGGTPPSARSPFWSPDGRWIGFSVGTADLRKISVTGGPSVTLARTGTAPRGATWGSNDTIVYATNDGTTGLLSVPAGGGDPTVLTKPDASRGEADHLFPSFLPGNRAVLFTIAAQGSSDNGQIAVFDFASGTYKTVLRGGSNPEYVASGHLLYATGGTLRAVRFDPDRLEVVGDPVPVLEQVTTVSTGAAGFSVATNGTLAYLPGGPGGSAAQRSLVWVDRTGRETSVNTPLRAYQFPRVAPDGSRIAVSILDQQNDVWVFDIARQTLTPLTFDPAVDQQPGWFADGKRIAFASARTGNSARTFSSFNLFVQQADGTGSPQPLTAGPNNHFTPSISADGKFIFMLEQFAKTGNDVTVLRVGDERSGAAAASKTEPLFQTAFSEVAPEISPDGRWLAYVSDDSGQQQVYVHPFPNVSGGRWQVSAGEGSRPVWARNGRELFYATAAGAIMAVPIQGGETFTYGNAVKLFDWPTIAVPGLGRTYDVAPDGRRFLMIKEATSANSRDAPPSTITVVVNWTEVLKQALPPQ